MNREWVFSWPVKGDNEEAKKIKASKIADELIRNPQKLADFMVESVLAAEERKAEVTDQFYRQINSTIGRHDWKEEADKGILTEEQSTGIIDGLSACRPKRMDSIVERHKRRSEITFPELITFGIAKGWLNTRHELTNDRLGAVRDIYQVVETGLEEMGNIRNQETVTDLYFGNYPVVKPESFVSRAVSLGMIDFHPESEEVHVKAIDLASMDDLAKTTGRIAERDRLFLAGSNVQRQTHLCYLMLKNGMSQADIQGIFRLARNFNVGDYLNAMVPENYLAMFDNFHGNLKDLGRRQKLVGDFSQDLLEVAQSGIDFPVRQEVFRRRSDAHIPDINSPEFGIKIAWEDDSSANEEEQAVNQALNHRPLTAKIHLLVDPTPMRNALQRQADNECKYLTELTGQAYLSVPFAQKGGLSGLAVVPGTEGLSFTAQQRQVFDIIAPRKKLLENAWADKPGYIVVEKLEHLDPKGTSYTVYAVDPRLAPMSAEALYLTGKLGQLDYWSLRSQLNVAETSFPRGGLRIMANRGHKYILADHPELRGAFSHAELNPNLEGGIDYRIKLDKDENYFPGDANVAIQGQVNPRFFYVDVTRTDELTLTLEQTLLAKKVIIDLARISCTPSDIEVIDNRVSGKDLDLNLISRDGRMVAVGGTKVDRRTGMVVPKGPTGDAEENYNFYHRLTCGPHFNSFQTACQEHTEVKDPLHRPSTFRSPSNSKLVNEEFLLMEPPKSFFG